MEVYSNPVAELSSTKEALVCSELHLGDHGITALRGFERFTNLSVLWLNKNKLTALDGLEKNFRIKNLYAHENIIRKMGSSLATFLSLNILSLYNNKLDDIQDVVSGLKHMRYLTSLDLSGNPIAQEDNYRSFFVVELPNLKILDRKAITKEERQHAITLQAKLAQIMTMKAKKSTFLTDDEIFINNSRRHAMDVCLQMLATYIYNNRIGLEESLVSYDPRKLGLISEDIFWRIMEQYGLKQMLSKEQESAIIYFYKKDCKIDAISPTMTLQHPKIQYQRFCADCMPKQLRTLTDEWKFSAIPPISRTTMDLQSYVKTVKVKQAQLELLRSQSMLSRGGHDDAAGNAGSSAASFVAACAKHGLSPWNAAELGQSIRSYFPAEPVTGDPTWELERSQLSAVIDTMKLNGLSPVMGSSAVEKLLYTGPGGELLESIPVNKVHLALGSQPYAHRKKAVDPNAAPESPIGRMKTEDPMDAPVPSGPVVQWRVLNPREVDSLSSEVFKEADEAYDTLCRMNGDTSLMTPSFNTATHNSRIGTRLASMKVKSVAPVGWRSPKEIVSGSTNRADFVVIPNVRKEPSTSQSSLPPINGDKAKPPTTRSSIPPRNLKVVSGWDAATTGTILMS